MYPVCFFALGWCPWTTLLSSASATCTSLGAKSDSSMLPNGLDPVFNLWVYPTQTDSLEDRKRHNSLAAAFSLCFVHCLQSNSTSKKPLPKGRELQSATSYRSALVVEQIEAGITFHSFCWSKVIMQAKTQASWNRKNMIQYLYLLWKQWTTAWGFFLSCKAQFTETRAQS